MKVGATLGIESYRLRGDSLRDSGQAGMTEKMKGMSHRAHREHREERMKKGHVCKEIVKNVKHGIVINQGVVGNTPPSPM